MSNQTVQSKLLKYKDLKWWFDISVDCFVTLITKTFNGHTTIWAFGF